MKCLHSQQRYVCPLTALLSLQEEAKKQLEKREKEEQDRVRTERRHRVRSNALCTDLVICTLAILLIILGVIGISYCPYSMLRIFNWAYVRVAAPTKWKDVM